MFAASKSGSPAEATDAQFNYVTMLLHGDGTNGAQNNTFLDSSTNNFTITRNGNTTQGTFTPYGSNWSNYFNGSSSLSISSANTVLPTGTQDFSVELFVNWQTQSGSYPQIISNPTTSGFQIYYDVSAGALAVGIFNVANVITYTIAQSDLAGSWTHIAVTRSGTTFRLFVNGVLRANGTNVISFASPTTQYIASDGSRPYTGYISNVRTVLGSIPTAYQTSSTTNGTSVFTPSTTPLTAVSGTALLTCADNRFIDDSTNAFAITANGSPSVQRFSPFSPTTAYSTSVIGGSGYFDGSGDYLTTPQNAAFNIGTGQFTVECFIYWNGTALANGGYGLINLGNGANGGGPFTGWGLILDFDSGGKPTFYRFDGTVYSYQSSTNPTANQWIHLAVSRNSSNTLSIWMNGIRVYTGTVTTSFNNVNSDPLNIGYRQDGGTGGTHYFPGYISNARVVVGTDVYGAANSTITVPTAPLTAITNTSLLLNYTNAGILDNAMMNDLETVGNAQISTSVKKFGTGSIALDGTDDRLNMPSSPNLAFGTGDFTLECWAYFTSVASFPTITDSRVNTSSTAGFNLGLSTAKVQLYTTSQLLIGSSTLSTNTWYHIAVTRASGTLKIWLNGVQDATVSNSTNWSDQSFVVGATPNAANLMSGYIDDLRLTKGFCRYTATFTPPTAAFADKG